MPSRLLVAFLWLVLGSSSLAGSDRWVSVGPSGRWVKTVQIDPADSSTLFAVGGLVYKTTDSGGSWAELPSPAADLGPLAVGAASPSTLFLGMRIYRANPVLFRPPLLVDSALLRSSDNGSNWYRLSLPAPTALAVDRQSPRSVFAAFTSFDASPFGHHGLFESRDEGTIWTKIFDPDVIAVAVSPDSSSTLYAVTFRDGPWKSEDGGANWAPANAGLIDPSATLTSVASLAVDPSDPNTLYVSTRSYFDFALPTTSLFRSSDAGRSWTKVNSPPAPIGSLAVLADSRGTLYAGTSQGVFRSVDGGHSWVGASEGLTNLDIWALIADPSSRTLYAVTGAGLFHLEQGPLRSPARTISFR